MPSIYPETLKKKPSNSASTDSVAHFEQAQWQSITNEQEQVAKEKKEKEEKTSYKFMQQALGFWASPWRVL